MREALDEQIDLNRSKRAKAYCHKNLDDKAEKRMMEDKKSNI